MVFIRNIVFMAIAFAMVSSVVDAKRKEKDFGPLADRDTWREITQGCERVVLFVFFPWCEHCRNFHKTWDGLRDEFKDDKTLCFMANDCDDDEGDKFCQDLEVNVSKIITMLNLFVLWNRGVYNWIRKLYWVRIIYCTLRPS